MTWLMPQRGPKEYTITRHARDQYETRFPERTSIEDDLKKSTGASTMLIKRLRQCCRTIPRDGAFWVHRDVVFAGIYEGNRFIVRTVLIRPLSEKASISLGKRIIAESKEEA